MKLPATKRERVLVFIMIGVGIVLLGYTIFQIGIIPVLEARKKTEGELEDYKEKLAKARKELSFAAQIGAEYNAVSAQIGKLSAENVLHPILGSYLVGVTETLEEMARQVALKVEDVQEVGLQDFPAKKKDGSPPAFRSYAVQASASGSYEQTVAFVKLLEERNPYVCVTELRISGQSDNPERHRVSLRIEWPVEAPPEPAAAPAAPPAPPAAPTGGA